MHAMNAVVVAYTLDRALPRSLLSDWHRLSAASALDPTSNEISLDMTFRSFPSKSARMCTAKAPASRWARRFKLDGR